MLRESGTHDELLAQRGLYYRLFELQYAAMANSDRLWRADAVDGSSVMTRRPARAQFSAYLLALPQ